MWIEVTPIVSSSFEAIRGIVMAASPIVVAIAGTATGVVIEKGLDIALTKVKK